MGAIFKRARVWYIDVRSGGHRIRKRVGASKEVAILALKDAEVKIARKEFGFYNPTMGVEDFFRKYVEYSRANHATSSTKRYASVIDNFRLFLRTRKDVENLEQISTEVIEEYKAFRKDHWIGPRNGEDKRQPRIRGGEQSGAKAKTINFELNALRTVLYVAVKWGYLTENPLKNVQRLKLTDSKRIRFLSAKECHALCMASPDDLLPIFQTLLLTGMRKGELENLEWADVDFKRRKIMIRRKLFWQPKTGEREIPIGSQLLPILRRLDAANSKGLKSNFVFPHKDGSRIKVKLRDQLIKVAQAAGIKDLSSIHALRHTFASQLVMNGVDLPTVQRLMGHSDIQTTLIYAHLAPDHLADAVDKLAIKV